MRAGLRPKVKALDKPPDSTVRALALYSTTDFLNCFMVNRHKNGIF